MISDVIGYEADSQSFIRTVYAGNAVTKVKSVNNSVDFLTVRSSNWDAVEEGIGEGNTAVSTLECTIEAPANGVRFISEEIVEQFLRDIIRVGKRDV